MNTVMSIGIKRHISEVEWKLACRNSESLQINKFTPDQLKKVNHESQRLQKWKRNNWKTHNLINISIILGLLVTDYFLLLKLAPLFLNAMSSLIAQSIYGILFGIVHGFLAYSLVNYSLHEGAAHESIITVKGKFTKILSFLANNSCRLYFADPIFYHVNHLLHHQKFATFEDGAFSNFVSSRRILKSLLPLAMLFNITDYKIHSGISWSFSRLVSAAVGGLYFLIYFYFVTMAAGWLFALLSLGLIGTWVGFVLDRFRESSEHTLLPLNTLHGSRNLGTGFWAMIIGGGPWGQPCHLSHHLAPQLSWYHQLALHSSLLKIMTPDQKEQFIVPGGLLGFPRFAYSQFRKIQNLESSVL